jgi:RNA polymerase sigma-70 factor, ECF subfamily
MNVEFALIQAARRMDETALIGVFDMHSRPLYQYVLKLTKDPVKADRIVGDVFAKLLAQWSAGQGPRTNLRSYLYEETYHLVVNEERHSKQQTSFEGMNSLGLEGSTLLANSQNRVLFEAVINAIQQELSNEQRHVIILRFLEGFSLRETAKIIGKDVGHVKVIQNRGIAKLQKVLDDVTVESVESNLSEVRNSVNVSNASTPAGKDLFQKARSKLAGDGTTDAPPPENKKKKKGK